MPLYKISPASVAGFMGYFNAHSHNGLMGKQELRAVLNRAGVDPTNAELQEVIDLVSVDFQKARYGNYRDRANGSAVQILWGASGHVWFSLWEQDFWTKTARGISWQCFIDLVSSYTSFRDVEQEYADAFRIYDVSGNGVLSREDIKYVMNKLGINCNVDQLMEDVDKNHDNRIDYDEFVDMMKRKVM